MLAKDGPLVVDTGHFTGRSPLDKFVVKDEVTRDPVDWGDINRPMSEAHFAALKADMLEAIKG